MEHYTRHYLQKHQLVELQVTLPPSSALGMVVVIPCYREPDITAVLMALKACARPRCDVEVLVVVNAKEGDDADALRVNGTTIDNIVHWKSSFDCVQLRTHVLNFPALPRQDAGVGLARKLGLDEAVARLTRAQCDDGILVCLDADCICDPNYLSEIERYFTVHQKSAGCSIYFEHPLVGPLPARVYRHITEYELFLRYYRYGLQFARFPYAFFTVGSCMAVRASAYVRQGGMNRRQAGEDFYFLNKIMQLGGFGELNTTRVVPAVRVSSRVPFGTGRALGEALEQTKDGQHGSLMTYAPEVFRELTTLFAVVDSLYDMSETDPFTGVSPLLANYLVHLQASDRLTEIRGNTASLNAFRKRFFTWFNAFRVMKFIHHASAQQYPYVDIATAAGTLLTWTGAWPGQVTPPRCAAQLLNGFRTRDRTGNFVAALPNP